MVGVVKHKSKIKIKKSIKNVLPLGVSKTH